MKIRDFAAFLIAFSAIGPVVQSDVVSAVQTDQPTLQETSIVYVSEWDGREEIYVMSSDGSHFRRLTTTVRGTGSWQPAWSPDRRKIAFASDRDGNSEIYVMDADGSRVQRLTHTPDRDMTPGWSPDGMSLVFVSEAASDSTYSINVLNADGSGLKRLIQYGRLYLVRPTWSPDGKQLAFSAGIDFPDGEWEWDIYTIHADGTNIRRLTRHAKVNYQARWSPDGERIVFDSTRDGNWDIYLMNSDGSDVQRLTQHEAVDARPVWSPDGRRIAFHSRRQSEHSEIYVVDLNGLGVRRLTFSKSFSVHPDW